MVSQRSHPRLACVHLKPQGEGWIAAATGHGSIPLAPNPPGCRRHRYEIWGDEGEAEDAGDAAAAWFSNVLDTPVRLVRAPLVQPRRRERAGRQFALGFADGYPLLICHEASLTDLNEALEAEGAPPVPMDRFRPNVVVAGGTAGAELEWSALDTPVGRLELATPCERCSVTTVDQRTGKRPRGAQPLALLARRGRGSRGTKAIFGRNAFALPAGAALRVGMELQPCSGDAPGGFVSSPPNSH